MSTASTTVVSTTPLLGVPPTRWSFAYHLHSLTLTVARWLMRVLYFQPMFRARCEQVGRGLQIYLGLPEISGPVSLHVGDGLKLNARGKIVGQRAAGSLVLGDHASIGFRVTLHVGKALIVGDRARLADNCTIGAGPGVGTTVIGDDVWVGTGASIAAGVCVGAGSVVAAGASVLVDVPRNCVVAGSPARVVRRLETGDEP